jgi:Bacterial Ig-like domain
MKKVFAVLAVLAVVTGLVLANQNYNKSTNTLVAKAAAEVLPSNGEVREIGVTHMQESLKGDENSPSMKAAINVMSTVTGYSNIHTLGFGNGDPLNGKPANWNSLSLAQRLDPASYSYNLGGVFGDRLKYSRAAKSKIVVTLCCSIGWTRYDNSSTWAGGWDSKEIDPQYYPVYAALALKIARDNPDIKVFQVWNEFKGFWGADHEDRNRWGYRSYTELYNMVYKALKDHDSSIKVGGPYIVARTTRPENTGDQPSTITGTWGALEQRPLDAILYWNKYKLGADFVAIDGANGTDCCGFIGDPLAANTKFSTISKWLTANVNLPIWWSEFYSRNPGDPNFTTPSQLEDSLYQIYVVGKSQVALHWSPQCGPGDNACIWKDTQNGGSGGTNGALTDVLQRWNSASKIEPTVEWNTLPNNIISGNYTFSINTNDNNNTKVEYSELWFGTKNVGKLTGASTNKTITLNTATLPDGVYNVRATSTNYMNNRGESPIFSVRVANTNTPPTNPTAPLDLVNGSDSGSSDSDNITNDRTPTFTGACTTGQIINLYVDNIAGPNTTCVASSFSISQIVALGDGTHSIQYSSKNAIGTESTKSPTLTITVDSSAPAAPSTPDLDTSSDDGVSTNDNSTTKTDPIFVGNCATGEIINLYDGNNYINGSTTCANNRYSILSATSIALGTHAIGVKIADIAGNVSPISPTLSISIVAPPIQLPTPTITLSSNSDTGKAGDNLTKYNKPTFTGSCNISGAQVMINIDNISANNTNTGVVLCSTTSPFVYSHTLTTALSEGVHSINARITDNLGNESPTSSNYNFSVDTTPPNAISLSASNITSSLTNTRPTIAGTSAAGNTVTVQNENNVEQCKILVTNSGSWSCNVPIAQSIALHTFKVFVVDPAGNSSPTTTLNYTLVAVSTNNGGDSSSSSTTASSSTSSVSSVSNSTPSSSAPPIPDYPPVEPPVVTVTPTTTSATVPTSYIPLTGTSTAGNIISATDDKNNTLCTTVVSSSGVWSCNTTALGDGTRNISIKDNNTTTNTIKITTSDDDGVKAEVEDLAPNNGDGNGDGTADKLQASVTSIKDASSNSFVTIDTSSESSCGSLKNINVYNETDLAQADSSRDYKYGFVGFKVNCSSPINIRTYWHGISEFPAGTKYIKFGRSEPGNSASTKYFELPVKFGTKLINNKQVAYSEYTYTDGGIGDDTGRDGVISDPSGPVFPNSVEPNIVSNQSNQSQNFMLWIIGILIGLIIVGATYYWMKKKSHKHIESVEPLLLNNKDAAADQSVQYAAQSLPPK